MSGSCEKQGRNSVVRSVVNPNKESICLAEIRAHYQPPKSHTAQIASSAACMHDTPRLIP